LINSNLTTKREREGKRQGGERKRGEETRGEHRRGEREDKRERKRERRERKRERIQESQACIFHLRTQLGDTIQELPKRTKPTYTL
jgi:hypothetical protein